MSYALKPAVILILLTKPGNVLSSKRSNMHGKAPEPGQICFFASFFSSKERRPLVIKKSDSRHPDRRRCPHQLPELYFFPSRERTFPGHASPLPAVIHRLPPGRRSARSWQCHPDAPWPAGDRPRLFRCGKHGASCTAGSGPAPPPDENRTGWAGILPA